MLTLVLLIGIIKVLGTIPYKNEFLKKLVYSSQRNLGKCQVYIFGSIIMLLLGIIQFSLYQGLTSDRVSYQYFFETICFPIFLLYKLYSLWVVRCFAIGIIRDKRRNTQTSIRRDSKTARYEEDYKGSGGSIDTHTGSLGRAGKAPGHTVRGLEGNGNPSQGYAKLRGIDDILLEIQFPQDGYIPLERFKIGVTFSTK
jgi:hypothetical protein